jgi:hypothetical protein
VDILMETSNLSLWIEQKTTDFCAKAIAHHEIVVIREYISFGLTRQYKA